MFKSLNQEMLRQEVRQANSRAQTRPLNQNMALPLRIAKALSVLMDASIKVPFINRTIGLDGLLGAFPVAGDVITMLVSLYGVGLAVYYKAPAHVVGKMVGNIAVDLLVGVIPVLGDVFDVFFRANIRNYNILMRWLEVERPELIYPDLAPHYGHHREASTAVVDVETKARDSQ